MKYREYGSDQKDTILLLHGGGLSWWNYRAVAEFLQAEYHIILPVLDGHAGSDRPFMTIEDNAAEIISFIDSYLEGSVQVIGGLSLGAQILLEMLSQRGSICRYALVESAAVIPSKNHLRHDRPGIWLFLWAHKEQSVCDAPIPITSHGSGAVRGILP